MIQNTKPITFQEMIKKVNKYLWDFYNLHSIIIAIAGFDDHVGKILYANRWAHRLLKYSPGSLIGKNVKTIMRNEEDREQHDSYLAEYLKHERLGMVLNEGRVVEARDGEGNLLPSYLSVIEKDIDGRRVFIGFMTDLSAQTEAMEDAQAAASAKANFLASMSHEIRTPMNSILGRADLISHMEISDEVKEHIDVIIGAGENLVKIINDILDFSKAEAGKIVMEKICFDLQRLIDKVINIMRTPADRKGVELKLEASADIPQIVIGDPTKLHQVLINLLSNAIKFTEKGGVKCIVKVEEKKDNFAVLRFSIADTGIGIPQSKLDGIFSPFSQADSSTTREFGGTGLGLSITKEYVEMMDGSIWADSIMGKGSTFHFTMLFELSYECKLDDESRNMHVDAGNLSSKCILLVEDNEENINLAKMFLKDSGCRLDVAKNGKEGVEKFRAQDYNLILMDVEMPVMDGWEATRQIREWEKDNAHEETPLVILTAHAMEEHKKKAFELGANDFITKPTRKRELLAAITAFLVEKDIRTNKESDHNRIVVEVDKDLEDIVPEFLKAMDKYLEKLDKAIKESNFEEARLIGHSLKGSGLGYGFEYISRAGEDIEQSAIEKNLENIIDRTKGLRDYLSRVEIKYVETI